MFRRFQQILVRAERKRRLQRVILLLLLRQRMLHWNDALRLAPLRIVAADHDVEAPVAPLFLGFYEAERLHVEKIVFHPDKLLFAQAAALQVHRHARQMR